MECLQGKGTISATAEYGRSVIPAAKDTGRSYKAINLMDARCEFFEFFFGDSSDFLATFFFVEAEYLVYINNSGKESGNPTWDMPEM